jgi:hypothetical protein
MWYHKDSEGTDPQYLKCSEEGGSRYQKGSEGWPAVSVRFRRVGFAVSERRRNIDLQDYTASQPRILQST